METISHQAGFVTIIGKPNAGKSTLINSLLGERLAIVTPKAQTTRRSLCGILHGPSFQIVFTDTPGMLEPAYTLQESMMQDLTYVLQDADIILWLVDVRDQDIPPLVQKIRAHSKVPLLLLLNKIDLLADQQEIANRVLAWQEKVAVTQVLPIAGLTGLNLHEVHKHILTHLPVHPPYYPPDMLTDKPVRFFAAEIMREQILNHYHQEIPYSVEVVIEHFKEMPNITHIHALIYVEKQSQKAILIGKEGGALKKIGIMARQALEIFLNRPVFLQQHVKVLANWRNEKKMLRRLGYIPG